MQSDKAIRVLVIDDVLTNRELARRLLASQGYDVAAAADGEVALEMVESQDFDIILLDIQMPGLDGFEVCRRIRQKTRYARVPVILLSAVDESADLHTQSTAAGATAFLPKPYTVEELIASVNTALGCP